MSTEPNPWDILAMRRKIKKYEATGINESIKLLKKVKEMNLSNKMLKATQFPRTLRWIIIKTNNSSNSQEKLFNNLCKFLFKLWKSQLQKDLQQNGGSTAKKQTKQTNNTNQEKNINENDKE